MLYRPWHAAGHIRWVTLNQKNTVARYNHTSWATSRISLLLNLFAKSLSEINCSRKTDLTEKNLLDTTITDCLHWYIILEVSEHCSFIRQRPPPSCKGDVMGMLHHTSPVYSHRCYRFPNNFWQEECKTKHMNSSSASGFHLNCYGSSCTVSSAKLQMSCNIQPSEGCMFHLRTYSLSDGNLYVWELTGKESTEQLRLSKHSDYRLVAQGVEVCKFVSQGFCTLTQIQWSDHVYPIREVNLTAGERERERAKAIRRIDKTTLDLLISQWHFKYLYEETCINTLVSCCMDVKFCYKNMAFQIT